MNEGASQQEWKFWAGPRTWITMGLVGIIGMVIFPVVPLMLGATTCGMTLSCFLVDHSMWVAGISAAVGLVGGMYLSFKLAEHSHKKKHEDQPFRPETLGDRRTENMVERRQADARIAWLSRLGNERDNGPRRR